MNEPQNKVIRALHRTPLFAGVGVRHLYQLLEGAERRETHRGQAVYDHGSSADALYVLIRGQLESVGRDGSRQLIEPCACFGDFETLTGRQRLSTVVATLPSTVVRIGWQRIATVMRRSAAFRRNLAPPEQARPRIEAALFDRSAETVVLLVEDGLPAERLAGLLAHGLQADYGDGVCIVRATPGQRGVSPREPGPVAIHRISADPRVLYSRAFSALAQRYTYVFIDVSHTNSTQRRGFVESADKVVNVFRNAPPLRGSAGEGTAWFDTVVIPRGGWGRARPELVPGTCRLRLDPERLARARDLDGLHPEDRSAIGRWGRAVTDRTVGLALGGGGAWGYAHVALLRALHRRVPIDVVSGSSFGAVAGAFYTVGGLDALDRLVAAGSEMREAVLVSMVNSRVLERFVRRTLGHHFLEDLAPVLLPVATDVSTGELTVLRGLTVAEAVRASSAFPGALTPATRMPDGQRRRLVDGGIASNVPDAVLHSEGADFVIAANVVPPPPKRAPHRQLLPGAFGTWLHEFNPLARTVDAYRSAFILMHAAGYNDASLADVVYNAEPVDFFALDFHRSAQIVTRAEAEIEAWAEAAEARWRASLTLDPLSRRGTQ